MSDLLRAKILELEDANSKLSRTIRELRRDLLLCRSKLDFYELHPKIATGNIGEIIVCQAVHGKLTPKNAGHDVDVPHLNLKIEVKFSNPSHVSKKNLNLRWLWTNVKGNTGKKQFDRLILVGKKIEAFSHQYKDENSPFVLYDIPFCSIDSVADDRKNGSKVIRLPVNWASVKSEKGKRCQAFEITIAELGERYGL